MGVYIKGMEMPTSCEKCPFLDYEEGFCLATGVKGKSGWYESKLCPGGIKDGRHADCPLIPVPPHGDLIDRDAIMDDIIGGMVFSGRNVPKEAAIVQKVLDIVGISPTIIPAEEGENDV